MSGPRSLSSLAKVRIDEMQYCDVDGKDLPLKMPIAKYSELTELPPSLSSRLSTSKPSLLESYAAPIVLAGRDLALFGASPNGGE